MSHFNKVILTGNLTRDPELRYTPKGSAIASLCIATTRKFNSESGEGKEETAFVDVDAWGRQAETLCQYVKKGHPLLVEGRLKLDTWEDKATKQTRTKLKVVLESFTFLNSKPDTQSQPRGGPSAKHSAPTESSDPPF